MENQQEKKEKKQPTIEEQTKSIRTWLFVNLGLTVCALVLSIYLAFTGQKSSGVDSSNTARGGFRS